MAIFVYDLSYPAYCKQSVLHNYEKIRKLIATNYNMRNDVYHVDASLINKLVIMQSLISYFSFLSSSSYPSSSLLHFLVSPIVSPVPPNFLAAHLWQ